MAFSGTFGGWPQTSISPVATPPVVTLPVVTPSVATLPTFGGWPQQTLPIFGGWPKEAPVPIVTPSIVPAFWSQTSIPAVTNPFNGWPQTSTTPVTASTASTASTVLPVAAPISSEKNGIINCLTESKNIQIAILNELKIISQKSINPVPVPVNNQVHLGISCDCCGTMNIIGMRYKCIFCKNFDMCEQCEAKTTTHDPSHLFVKVKDTNNYNMSVEKFPYFKQFLTLHEV